MSIKTDYILKGLLVLSWILFAGLGIEAGGFITNTVATLAFTPEGATRFWKIVNLDAVYRYNQSYYVTLTANIIIVAVLKAIMFYVIVRFLHSNKLDLAKPFNETTKRMVLCLGYLSLGIGLFSFWGARVADGIAQQGVAIPDLRGMKLAGADVWMFMGVILLIVAFIFKKGIEIQNENELTV